MRRRQDRMLFQVSIASAILAASLAVYAIYLMRNFQEFLSNVQIVILRSQRGARL